MLQYTVLLTGFSDPGDDLSHVGWLEAVWPPWKQQSSHQINTEELQGDTILDNQGSKIFKEHFYLTKYQTA